MARKSTGLTLTLTGDEHEFLADLVLAYMYAACPPECEGQDIQGSDLDKQDHKVAHALFRRLECLRFAEEDHAEHLRCKMDDFYEEDEEDDDFPDFDDDELLDEI